MKSFILILIHSFFILFFISSLSAQSNNKSTKNQIRNIEQKMAALPQHEKKLNSLLLDIVNEITLENSKENLSGEQIYEKYSSDVSILDKEARIYVKITIHDTATTENINKLVSDLEKQEVLIENVYVPEINITSRPIIFAKVKYYLIKEIVKDIRILNIANVIKPGIRIGSVTTEGDSLLNADLARLQHGVDGGTLNSIKIGVISDGIQGYQASMDSGDVNNISWLSSHDQADGNEGLAMIEIIQDIAPGSMPMFASAFLNYSSQNLITIINDLFSSGSDIIVDDVYYSDDPMFQDGDLATAIAGKISTQGLTYISAAGNDGNAMWTGEMYTDVDSMQIWGEDGQNNYDIRNYVHLEAGDAIEIILQWDDNWQDAENNYDLYLFSPADVSVGSGGKTVQGAGLNQKPLEQLEYNVPSTGEYYIQVRGVSGDFSRDIKVLADKLELEYIYSNIYETSPREQIYGHPAAAGAISVAAFPADDPTILEYYSSRGPTILSPYSSPEERQTPVITATDGVVTGVPGFEYFGGTSASAPHIAGIAALYFDKYGSSKTNIDFFNDLKDNGQTIAGENGGEWHLNSGYGKADAYFTLGDIPSSVTFYQYDSSGSYVDSVSHWIGYWKKDRAPHTYEWSLYSNHVVEATDKIIENEKYHHWNVDEYLNHKNVYVSAGLPDQEAYLQPVVDLVTIKTELTAGGSGGNIDFKDPWYEDFNEPPYGYRNRGTSAIFHSQASPLNLTLASSYKGVILNQELDDPTYYSVRASEEETFNAHGEDFTGYFLNWQAEPELSAEFQNANNLETPVVFRQDDANIKALYKGNMVSENSIATGYNNARRIVRDGSGTYHIVYEDNNEIWYSNSSDVTNWIAEVRLSGTSVNGMGHHNPAIALDADPSGQKIIVVWEAVNENGFSGVEHYVCYRQKYQGAWSSTEYFPPDPMFQSYYLSSETIYPAVYAEGIGYTIVTWKVRSVSDEQERVFIRLKTQGEWTDMTEVPNAIGHPALTRKISGSYKTKIVWSDGVNIKLIGGEFVEDAWQWDDIEYVTFTPRGYANDFPSIVVDENNYLHISWQIRELTGQQREFIAHKDDQYNYQTQFLKTGYTMHSPSVTANTSNGNIRLAYHATTTYGLSSVRTIESPHTQYFWSPEELVGYGKYPSYVPYSPVSRLVYTEYTTSPYFLTVEQPYTQKSNNSNITNYSRRKEIAFTDIQLTPDKAISGLINLEVEFNDFYSGFISQTSIPNNFLQTPVFIPASDSLKIAYKISLYDIAVKKSAGIISSDYPDIEISLIDNKSQNVISKRQHLFSDLVKSLSDTTYEFNYQLNTRAFRNKEIYLDFDFISSNKNDAILSQIYTFWDDSTMKLNSEDFAKEVIIPLPEKFFLHPAYPNPFNPAAKIAFDIPEQSDVSLKVYNIQGKLITELFNGNKEAGRYTARFDGGNLASGIYFYEMVATTNSNRKNFREVKKMMLVK